MTNSSTWASDRLALDVAGQRRAVVSVGDGTERKVHLTGGNGCRSLSHGIEQGPLEDLLEHGALLEQPEVPFPALVHSRQASVVEFVAAVERQVQVVIGQRIHRAGIDGAAP